MAYVITNLYDYIHSNIISKDSLPSSFRRVTQSRFALAKKFRKKKKKKSSCNMHISIIIGMNFIFVDFIDV